jgi:hypothetical protein
MQCVFIYLPLYVIHLPMKKATYFIILFSLAVSSCDGGPGFQTRLLIAPDEPKGEVSIDDFIKEPPLLSYTYQIGPVDLEADDGTKDGEVLDKGLRFKLDSPIWFESLRFSVERGDEEVSPEDVGVRLMLKRLDGAGRCAGTNGTVFAMADSITPSISLPSGSGYPLRSGEEFEAEAVLVNRGGNYLKGISVTFTIEGIPITDVKKVDEAEPVLLDANDCRGPMGIPPGGSKEIKATSSPQHGGIIKRGYLFASDHMSSVSTSVGGNVFWEGSPELDEEYRLVTVPTFEDAKGVQIKDEEGIEATFIYSNPSPSWYDHGFGTVLFYVVHEGGSGGLGGGEAESGAVGVQKKLLK